MIILKEYQNLLIGVLGLGKTGISVVNALLPTNAKIIAWDDKPPNNLEEKYRSLLTPLEDKLWLEISMLVLSPGIMLSGEKAHALVTLAKSLNKEIICDIELLYRHTSTSQYVGITGTNGKSTTTALTAHLLAAQNKTIAAGGNLGIPALELPKLSDDDDDIYVLELSSYQLDLLERAHFDVRVLLNITPDHLDHHGSMENYIKAKERIFRHSKPTDLNIIGIDTSDSYDVYQRILATANCLTIAISSHQILDFGISVINDVIYDHREEKKQFTLGPLKHLAGKHNAQNIAAAFAISMYYHLDPLKSIQAIQSFTGLIHRMQYVGAFKHITYINDSKATNADASAKALDSFTNIYWILGGVAKEGGIETLVPYFSKIKHAFLIGAAEEEFAKMLASHQVPYSKCNNLLNACNLAQQMALRDQHQVYILLSPACASFDQWKNFEERGEHFIKYVKNYCQ